MSGGGKGGSQTSTVQIPGYIEDAAKRNLSQAEQISQIGYVPYYGPDVAALTPMQESAMQNTAAAASAFGLGAPTGQGVTGMPAATEYAGGIRGYSSAPLYEQSLEQLAANRPGQKSLIDSFFADPMTGEYARQPMNYSAPAPTFIAPVASQGRDDGGHYNDGGPGSFGPGGFIGPQQDLPGNMVTRSLGIGAGAKTDDGGYAGESGDGTVMCTAYCEMGYLPKEIWHLDRRYGVRVYRNDPALIEGYHVWGVPLANYIRKQTLGAKVLRAVMWPIVKAWAEEMAHNMKPSQYKPNYFGKLIKFVGEPLSRMCVNLKPRKIKGVA